MESSSQRGQILIEAIMGIVLILFFTLTAIHLLNSSTHQFTGKPTGRFNYEKRFLKNPR